MSTIKRMLSKTFSFNKGLFACAILIVSGFINHSYAFNLNAGSTTIDTTYTPYQVGDGDNLYAISRKFSVPIDLLLYVNKINPERPKIFVGSTIQIPKLVIISDEKINLAKQDSIKFYETNHKVIIDYTDTSSAESPIDTIPSLPEITNVDLQKTDTSSKETINPPVENVIAVTTEVNRIETGIDTAKTETKKEDKSEKGKKKIKESEDTNEIIKFDDTTTERAELEKAPLDTTVRKKIRQNEKVKPQKNDKSVQTEFVDSSFFKKDIQLNTVQVEDKKVKKKKKYSLGDKVDPVTEEKAQFYLARAMKAIDERNFTLAESYIAKSLSLNPSYTEAYLLKGDLNSIFGYYDKAVKDYDKAVISNPYIPNSYYNRGTCYLRMHDTKKAMQDFTKAISLDSTYILAIGGRAALLMMDKEYYQAIDDYSRIITLNKFFSPAYKARGVARLEIGDYTGSLEDFDKYLVTEPNDAYVLYQRGLAKLKTGKLYECCIDLLKASELGSEESV